MVGREFGEGGVGNDFRGCLKRIVESFYFVVRRKIFFVIYFLVYSLYFEFFVRYGIFSLIVFIELGKG